MKYLRSAAALLLTLAALCVLALAALVGDARPWEEASTLFVLLCVSGYVLFLIGAIVEGIGLQIAGCGEAEVMAILGCRSKTTYQGYQVWEQRWTWEHTYALSGAIRLSRPMSGIAQEEQACARCGATISIRLHSRQAVFRRSLRRSMLCGLFIFAGWGLYLPHYFQTVRPLSANLTILGIGGAFVTLWALGVRYMSWVATEFDRAMTSEDDLAIKTEGADHKWFSIDRRRHTNWFD